MGEQALVSSDIYSVGAMLYEMLCGSRPRSANSRPSAIRCRRHQVLASRRTAAALSLVQDLPPQRAARLARCLRARRRPRRSPMNRSMLVLAVLLAHVYVPAALAQSLLNVETECRTLVTNPAECLIGLGNPPTFPAAVPAEARRSHRETACRRVPVRRAPARSCHLPWSPSKFDDRSLLRAAPVLVQ